MTLKSLALRPNAAATVAITCCCTAFCRLLVTAGCASCALKACARAPDELPPLAVEASHTGGGRYTVRTADAASSPVTRAPPPRRLASSVGCAALALHCCSCCCSWRRRRFMLAGADAATRDTSPVNLFTTDNIRTLLTFCPATVASCVRSASATVRFCVAFTNLAMSEAFTFTPVPKPMRMGCSTTVPLSAGGGAVLLALLLVRIGDGVALKLGENEMAGVCDGDVVKPVVGEPLSDGVAEEVNPNDELTDALEVTDDVKPFVADTDADVVTLVVKPSVGDVDGDTDVLGVNVAADVKLAADVTVTLGEPVRDDVKLAAGDTDGDTVADIEKPKLGEPVATAVIDGETVTVGETEGVRDGVADMVGDTEVLGDIVAVTDAVTDGVFVNDCDTDDVTEPLTDVDGVTVGVKPIDGDPLGEAVTLVVKPAVGDSDPETVMLAVTEADTVVLAVIEPLTDKLGVTDAETDIVGITDAVTDLVGITDAVADMLDENDGVKLTVADTVAANVVETVGENDVVQLAVAVALLDGVRVGDPDDDVVKPMLGDPDGLAVSDVVNRCVGVTEDVNDIDGATVAVAVSDADMVGAAVKLMLPLTEADVVGDAVGVADSACAAASCTQPATHISKRAQAAGCVRWRRLRTADVSFDAANLTSMAQCTLLQCSPQSLY